MDRNKRLSEAELIQNLRARILMDESIRAIYRDNFESLSRYVMQNNGSREDAEDIFQETVLNFIELVQLDKYRGESSIKTFLFAVNRHIWLNELKRRGRQEKREQRFDKELDKTEPDIAGLIMGRETRAQLMDLLGQLGESCKKVLVMFYYENLSIKEMLEKLEYENEQVIRNKKYKCLKQLEQLINSNPGLKTILKSMMHG